MGSCNSEERNSTNLGYKCFSDRLFFNKKWTIWTSLPMQSLFPLVWSSLFLEAIDS